MTRKKRRALLCMLAVPLLALAPRSEESLPASAAEPAAMPEKYVALTFDDGPWPETTEQLLDGLAERERKVIELRFGLADGHPRTLEEVGKEFGVTRERIRQIESKTLAKLRHPSRSSKLKDFMEE